MEEAEITDEEDIQSDEETGKEFFDICKLDVTMFKINLPLEGAIPYEYS